LSPIDSRIKELLDNKFTVNKISDTFSLITKAYQTPSPSALITFTNNDSVTKQPITDADGVQDIDGQCSVTVDKGVPLVIGTVEKYFT
jgi:hypothetical protein